ncbi:MAG: hypothetical protein GY801_00315 [bacterium]|nr:hypothetical protein [bacterium]
MENNGNCLHGGKKMRVLILCLVIANFLGGRLVQADDLASSINQEVSTQFQGYYYEVYEFKRNGSVDGFVAVLSSAFDAYLILIDPAGDISTNDDHNPRIELPGSRPSDAALLVDVNLAGRWLAIATTYHPGEEGDYTLRHEGVTDLHRVDRAQIDVKQVEKAFGERGVWSDAERLRREEKARVERLRREEEARVAKIEALVEQLSLRSYRREIKRELDEAITRQTDSYAHSRHRIDELEQREKALQDALVDADRLTTNSKALIRELLERELEPVQRNAEDAAANAVESLGKREAFAAALEALDRLDNVAMELQRAEASLLSAKTSEEVAVAQVESGRLREKRAALSAEIAEKLLDSKIVIRLRFGGFRTYRELWAIRMVEQNSGFSRRITRISGFSLGFASHGWPLMSVARSLQGLENPPEINAAVWLHNLLPWPPPDASTRAVIRPEFFEDFQEGRFLGDIDGILIEALVKAGYHGSSYLGVPNGFAIVTRLEQTDRHGVPLGDEARWSAKIQPIKSFSIVNFLRALLTSPPGYFRVITLVISDEPFSSSGIRMQLDTLEHWSRMGLNFPPPEIRELSYTEDYRVTALVYEFEKKTEHDQPEVHIPGELSVAKHLEHTRFAAYLL